MSLIRDLEFSKLLRPVGLPANLRNISLLILKEDLPRLENFLSSNPQARIKLLILPDAAPEILSKIRIEIAGETLPCAPLAELGKHPEYEKVFLCPANPGLTAIWLTQLCRFAASVGIETIYLASGEAPADTLRSPLPDFAHKNESALEKTLELFEDKFSEKTFTARIKTIITGNSGYLPVSDHLEYFHPAVAPEEGDFMIDGGVSDMVEIQKLMLQAVGSKGQIFGFEPIPDMAAKAARHLSAWPNYHLEPAGLSNKSGFAWFANLRDSSHLVNQSSQAAGQIRCQLTSIDEFLAQNHIRRLDCIKLDIEGAELLALQGASESIRKYHPKLIICLYHKPQDLFEIPLYIKTLVPQYRLFLAHSSCQFTDTILYAHIPPRQGS